MPILMTCKTSEGHTIKILSELLQNNIKNACFEFSPEGVHLRMMDPNKSVLFDVVMEKANFTIYKYKTEAPVLYVGVNLIHLAKMLRPIKRKDSLQLCVNSDNPTDLIISIVPKEATRHTASSIKNQTIQNIDIELPDGYGKSIIIPSSEFQKMCKGLGHISKVTTIKIENLTIRFDTKVDGVMTRYTEFGETDNFDDSDEEKESVETYCEDFLTEQIVRISKISGLSSNIHFAGKEGLPLQIKSRIGTLGELTVFLNSKSSMEEQ